MKLTIKLRLLPNSKQKPLLLETMKRFNEAASFAAKIGFDNKVFSQPSIHKLTYFEIRSRFSLSAQLAVRSIGKAVECFSRDKKVCPSFKPYGAVTYDQRNLCFKGLDRVSLSTLNGREIISMIYGEYQKERFDRIKGQCDLVFIKNKFYLMATIDIIEDPQIEVGEFIGIDLGIINIATDSIGGSYSGKEVSRNRHRRSTARKQYQRKGTKNAKRRLKKMSGRQHRFQTITNHRISKEIVTKAKALNMGIAMEDLTNIRTRIEQTVFNKRFHKSFGNWSFHQLRSFITYKAKLVGIPVVLVNPQNTSRACSSCGHCEKANRKTQDKFVCKSCGYSDNADHNAALNISAWAINKLASKAST